VKLKILVYGKIIFGLIFTFILGVLTFIFDEKLMSFSPLLRVNVLNSIFIFLGDILGPISYYLLLSAFFFSQKKKYSAFLLVLAGIFTFLLGTFFKIIFQRTRPNFSLETFPLLIKNSFSFPSTHAALAAATLLWLIKIDLKVIKIIGIILALMIMFTGYYNGVHYLSDVLGGIILGLGVGWLVFKNKERIKKILEKIKLRLHDN